jgi:anti-sigma regulatory factor (Ser/Thr protein kinase)
MSAASPSRQFSARFASLPELLAVATAACTAAGMNVPASHRVELVLEEAFSNSIRHGYLHRPPILPAHQVQRVRYLPQRAVAHGFHHHREDIVLSITA